MSMNDMTDKLDSLFDSDNAFKLSPEVYDAIDQVFPSDNPLDSMNFCAVDYINNIFPTEQSLTKLDDVINDTRYNIQCIDDDMHRIIRSQTNVADEAAKALDSAQRAIVDLFAQISEIKTKADESEAMVRDITRDIKQLDTAKRHLTTAITTLNHLHMLVGGVTNLEQYSKQRQYGDAAMLIQGLMQVLEYFKDYGDIPQIKDLSDRMKSIRDELGLQIIQDFHTALAAENVKNFSPNKCLAEACMVVSVLDPKVKRNLIKWILGQQLVEYSRTLFAENDESAWLDRVDSRYNWLKKHLMEFEERLGPLFPPDWEMSERITVEFCYITKRSLERIMGRRKEEIDTKLLLHALQRTMAFETLLSRRFSGLTIENNSFEESLNPFYEEDKQKTKENPFCGIISDCFSTYFSIYLDCQDRNLTELVERAATQRRSQCITNLANEGSIVLHSCGELFMFYKKCIQQCELFGISKEVPLFELSGIFKKHLKEYASKVLVASLPVFSPVSGGIANPLSGMSVSSLKKDFVSGGFIQNFQNLLRDADGSAQCNPLSSDEKVLLCTLLLTAEYCLETTLQLETKLKEKVADSKMADKISMISELDLFHGVINSCIQALVNDLDSTCSPFLASMCKMSWSTMESVGDQSPCITSIATSLKQAVLIIRTNLSSSRKYFTQFCVKFVQLFIPKYAQSVSRCKPLGSLGAEQLLLDTHSLKYLLIELPLGPNEKKAPISYTKIVIKGMSRIEMMLKVVMAPTGPNPVNNFVEQFVKLLPDCEISDLQKLLDMKAVKRADQTAYVELFQTLRSEKSADPLVGQIINPLVNFGLEGSDIDDGDETKIKKLENLIKRNM